MMPDFVDYRRNTERVIPVIVLTLVDKHHPDVPYGDDIHVWAMNTKPPTAALACKAGFVGIAEDFNPPALLKRKRPRDVDVRDRFLYSYQIRSTPQPRKRLTFGI